MPTMTTTATSTVSIFLLFSATFTVVSGGKNLQTSYDHQRQFQRAKWQQQHYYAPTSASVTQNRHQYSPQPSSVTSYHQQQQQQQHGGGNKAERNEIYDWYWDVQPFLGQNGAMLDHRPLSSASTTSKYPPAAVGAQHSRHSSSKNTPSISSSPGVLIAEDDEDDMIDDEDSPSSSAPSANPATSPVDTISKSDSSGGASSGSEDPNDLENLVNEYYYVGQKYDTLKTPSQRWVQNYFKTVLPNVVQSVRARWLDVRKRAGLESALALPVVGGVVMAVAGLTGLGMYAYRSRTVVETARKRRSLDEDNEGYSLGENIIRLMEVAKEMYDGFDVKSVDCHRRLMCQLSKTEAYRQVGADRAFKFASLVENWVNLPPPVKVLVDQLKFAVSFGKKDVENAENRRREARRLQQLQVPYYVSAGDASSVLEDKESSNGHQSLAEENFRDSCEIAFPDCDFSFEKFIVEHSRRK